MADDGLAFHNFQLSWVADTGELYLRELPDGILVVLGVIDDRDRLEQTLRGLGRCLRACGVPGWILDLSRRRHLGEAPTRRRPADSSRAPRGVPKSKFKRPDQLIFG